MKKKLLMIITSVLYLNAPVYAQPQEDAAPDESLELRKIMRDMGDEMKIIAGAISREDWALIVKASPKIADHPQPPLSEKIRIMAFAGTDMGEFKRFDGKTHDSARQLGVVAAGQNMQQNGEAVIDAFATLQKTCLACHQRFRKTFQKHFYGED